MDKDKSLKEIDSSHRSFHRGSLLNVDWLLGRTNPVHVRMYSKGAVLGRSFQAALFFTW